MVVFGISFRHLLEHEFFVALCGLFSIIHAYVIAIELVLSIVAFLELFNLGELLLTVNLFFLHSFVFLFCKQSVSLLCLTQSLVFLLLLFLQGVSVTATLL